MACFFEDDVPGKWTKLDANGEKEVEKAFQKGHPTVQSSFFNPRLRQNIAYHYNLDAMQQVNMTTGYIRRIKRELPVGAGSAPPRRGSSASFLSAPEARSWQVWGSSYSRCPPRGGCTWQT